MDQNYLDLFLQGGFIMVILLVVSIISLAIIFERIVYITRLKSKIKSIFDSDVKLEISYEAVEENLNRRIHILIFIVQLAPLLGILGTVLGLSDAFLSMGQLFGAQKFKFLALGVGKALSTTIAGLIIAAYTMSGHYLIKYLSTKVMKIVESELTGLVKTEGKENEE
jgi:biopolymer transport protein ExbB/TolQ